MAAKLGSPKLSLGLDSQGRGFRTEFTKTSPLIRRQLEAKFKVPSDSRQCLAKAAVQAVWDF